MGPIVVTIPLLLLSGGFQSGPTELEAPFRIRCDGELINVDSGHAAPLLTDLDGDGRLDLLLGVRAGELVSPPERTRLNQAELDTLRHLFARYRETYAEYITGYQEVIDQATRELVAERGFSPRAGWSSEISQRAILLLNRSSDTRATLTRLIEVQRQIARFRRPERSAGWVWVFLQRP